MITALSLFDVSHAEAAAFSIVLHFMDYAPVFTIGFIMLITNNFSFKKLREETGMGSAATGLQQLTPSDVINEENHKRQKKKETNGLTSPSNKTMTIGGEHLQQEKSTSSGRTTGDDSRCRLGGVFERRISGCRCGRDSASWHKLAKAQSTATIHQSVSCIWR